MNASVPTPKIGIPSIAPAGGRSVGICMWVGAAFLVGGCWKGVADPQARTLVLCLLSVGIALFAVALVLLRRRPVHPVVESSAPTSAEQKQIVAPVATPLGAVMAKPQQLAREVAAIEARPARETVSTSTIPAAEILHASRPVAGALDVTALMEAPLADLLLAALCKDPVGARRIFARALESEAPAVAQLTPSTSGAPAPSATPPERDVPAVAIAPATPAAP
jgi:hypothetical protein